MATKGGETKSRRSDKPTERFFGVPLGSALDILDGVAGLLGKYLAQRYEVEKRVEQIREETAEKVEELKDEAVRTGYAVKKAFFRTIVEAILLTTGMLSLILGLILLVREVIPLRYVLIGYGLLITTIVLLQLKTEA
jgi:hypothetical protein